VTEGVAWHPLDVVPPPVEVPRSWHAGYVAARLIQAYRVLHTLPSRIGPESFGNAWPTVLVEFGDLVDAAAWAQHAKDVPHDRVRWSTEDITLADEACAWPLQHLADSPRRADAVQVWAYAMARERSLRRLLRRRAERARAMAALAGCRPHQVDPRILSDTTLRRYLGPGLETLAERLNRAKIPVR
jgi:hypothetical protein